MVLWAVVRWYKMVVTRNKTLSGRVGLIFLVMVTFKFACKAFGTVVMLYDR